MLDGLKVGCGTPCLFLDVLPGRLQSLEEITGTISLSALDDYVAAFVQQDVPKALAEAAHENNQDSLCLVVTEDP